MTDRDLAIIRMFNQKKTYTEISNALGITRGAVAGVLNRARKKKNSPVKRSIDSSQIKAKKTISRKKPVKPVARQPQSKPTVEEKPVFKNTKQPSAKGYVHLLDANDKHCRWPIGNAKECLCCGKEVKNGSYCENHARIAYVQTPVKGKGVSFGLRVTRSY